MEKALFKTNYFLAYFFFIFEPILKIFTVLFKTFGMPKGDKIIFFLRPCKQSKILKKAVSGGWCKDSIILIAYEDEKIYSILLCLWQLL